MVLGGGASGRRLGLDEVMRVETPRMGLVPLEEAPVSLLPLCVMSCEDMAGRQKRATQKSASTRTQPSQRPDLGLPASRILGNTLFSCL